MISCIAAKCHHQFKVDHAYVCNYVTWTFDSHLVEWIKEHGRNAMPKPGIMSPEATKNCSLGNIPYLHVESKIVSLRQLSLERKCHDQRDAIAIVCNNCQAAAASSTICASFCLTIASCSWASACSARKGAVQDIASSKKISSHCMVTIYTLCNDLWMDRFNWNPQMSN